MTDKQKAEDYFRKIGESAEKGSDLRRMQRNLYPKHYKLKLELNKLSKQA